MKSDVLPLLLNISGSERRHLQKKAYSQTQNIERFCLWINLHLSLTFALKLFGPHLRITYFNRDEVHSYRWISSSINDVVCNVIHVSLLLLLNINGSTDSFGAGLAYAQNVVFSFQHHQTLLWKGLKDKIVYITQAKMGANQKTQCPCHNEPPLTNAGPKHLAGLRPTPE